MANKQAIDQIARSISFEVEAIPQDNSIQLTSTANTTPLNVKIKVRKKHDAEAAQNAILIIPKLDKPGAAPERIRLVSSDQTIMSFNVFMENEENKKASRKARKRFFDFFKAGAHTTVNDEGRSKQSPKKMDGSSNRLANEMYNDYSIQSGNISKDSSQSNKKRILGKCKPGGCLDPPFGEDKYAYDKKKQASLVKSVPLTALCNKALKIVGESPSMCKTKLFRKNNKSSFDNAVATIREFNDDTNSPSCSSLIQEENYEVIETFSNCLITYPPAVTVSEQKMHDRVNEKNMKNITSNAENNYRSSVQSSADLYYCPSDRKSSNRSNNKKNKQDLTNGIAALINQPINTGDDKLPTKTITNFETHHVASLSSTIQLTLERQLLLSNEVKYNFQSSVKELVTQGSTMSTPVSDGQRYFCSIVGEHGSKNEYNVMNTPQISTLNGQKLYTNNVDANRYPSTKSKSSSTEIAAQSYIAKEIAKEVALKSSVKSRSSFPDESCSIPNGIETDMTINNILTTRCSHNNERKECSSNVSASSHTNCIRENLVSMEVSPKTYIISKLSHTDYSKPILNKLIAKDPTALSESSPKSNLFSDNNVGDNNIIPNIVKRQNIPLSTIGSSEKATAIFPINADARGQTLQCKTLEKSAERVLSKTSTKIETMCAVRLNANDLSFNELSTKSYTSKKIPSKLSLKSQPSYTDENHVHIDDSGPNKIIQPHTTGETVPKNLAKSKPSYVFAKEFTGKKLSIEVSHPTVEDVHSRKDEQKNISKTSENIKHGYSDESDNILSKLNSKSELSDSDKNEIVPTVIALVLSNTSNTKGKPSYADDGRQIQDKLTKNPDLTKEHYTVVDKDAKRDSPKLQNKVNYTDVSKSTTSDLSLATIEDSIIPVVNKSLIPGLRDILKKSIAAHTCSLNDKIDNIDDIICKDNQSEILLEPNINISQPINLNDGFDELTASGEIPELVQDGLEKSKTSFKPISYDELKQGSNAVIADHKDPDHFLSQLRSETGNNKFIYADARQCSVVSNYEKDGQKSIGPDIRSISFTSAKYYEQKRHYDIVRSKPPTLENDLMSNFEDHINTIKISEDFQKLKDTSRLLLDQVANINESSLILERASTVAKEFGQTTLIDDNVSIKNTSENNSGFQTNRKNVLEFTDLKDFETSTLNIQPVSTVTKESLNSPKSPNSYIAYINKNLKQESIKNKDIKVQPKFLSTEETLAPDKQTKQGDFAEKVTVFCRRETLKVLIPSIPFENFGIIPEPDEYESSQGISKELIQETSKISSKQSTAKNGDFYSKQVTPLQNSKDNFLSSLRKTSDSTTHLAVMKASNNLLFESEYREILNDTNQSRERISKLFSSSGAPLINLANQDEDYDYGPQDYKTYQSTERRDNIKPKSVFVITPLDSKISLVKDTRGKPGHESHRTLEIKQQNYSMAATPISYHNNSISNEIIESLFRRKTILDNVNKVFMEAAENISNITENRHFLGQTGTGCLKEQKTSEIGNEYLSKLPTPASIASEIDAVIDADRQSESEQVASEKGMVVLDVAFQTYINSSNERVIKSFDCTKPPKRYQNDTISSFRLTLRPSDGPLNMSVDSSTDLYMGLSSRDLQLEGSLEKYNMISNMKMPTQVNKANAAVRPVQSLSKPNNADYNLQRVLSTVYNSHMVPLQDIIKHLKNDIDALATQQEMFKQKIMVSKKSRPVRISHTVKTCGCLRK